MFKKRQNQLSFDSYERCKSYANSERDASFDQNYVRAKSDSDLIQTAVQIREFNKIFDQDPDESQIDIDVISSIASETKQSAISKTI